MSFRNLLSYFSRQSDHEQSDSANTETPPKSYTAYATNYFCSLYNHAPNFGLGTITGMHHLGIPRLKGSLLFGRASEVTKYKERGFDRELKKLGALAMKHDRGMAYCSLGFQDTILVTKPSDYAQLRLYQQYLSRHEMFEAFIEVIGPHNLFSIENKGEQKGTWQKRRNELRKWIFESKALEELVGPMQDIIQQYIHDNIAKNSSINLEEFFTALTMNVVAQTILGTKELGNSIIKFSTAFSNALTAIADPNNTIKLKFAQFKKKYTGRDTITPLTEARALLLKTVKEELIQKHRENITKTLNMIKEIAERDRKPSDNSPLNLDTDDIYDEACTLLLAGHETTARLLQFTLMLLAQNPNHINKIREEVSTHKPEDGTWTNESLEKLEHLGRVIKETLRYYSPVPYIPRTVSDGEIILAVIPICTTKEEYAKAMATRDVTKDIVLHPGTAVLISPLLTHKLESIYENPNEFNPERHESPQINSTTATSRVKDAITGKDVIKETPFGWIPFGFDERNCPGRYFAFQEAKIALVQILEKFDLELDNYPYRHPFPTYARGTTLSEVPVEMKLVPRCPRLTDQEMADSAFSQGSSTAKRLRI